MVDGLWFRVQGSNRRNSGQTGHRTAPWPKKGGIPPVQCPAVGCGIAQWVMRISNCSAKMNRPACEARCLVGYLYVWSVHCSRFCSNAEQKRGVCQTLGYEHPRGGVQGNGRTMGPVVVLGGGRFLIEDLGRCSLSAIE